MKPLDVATIVEHNHAQLAACGGDKWQLFTWRAPRLHGNNSKKASYACSLYRAQSVSHVPKGAIRWQKIYPQDFKRNWENYFITLTFLEGYYCPYLHKAKLSNVFGQRLYHEFWNMFWNYFRNWVLNSLLWFTIDEVSMKDLVCPKKLQVSRKKRVILEEGKKWLAKE